MTAHRSLGSLDDTPIDKKSVSKLDGQQVQGKRLIAMQVKYKTSWGNTGKYVCVGLYTEGESS